MISDEDLFLSAIYIFVYVFLFALGVRLAPMFMLLSGIAGIFFSLEILRITGSLILTTLFITVSVFTMILGLSRAGNSNVRGL